MSDPESTYRQAEQQLRQILFGDGETSAGVVRGEERRLVASRVLRRMKQAFDDALKNERGSGYGLDEELQQGARQAHERADRET